MHWILIFYVDDSTTALVSLLRYVEPYFSRFIFVTPRDEFAWKRHMVVSVTPSSVRPILKFYKVQIFLTFTRVYLLHLWKIRTYLAYLWRIRTNSSHVWQMRTRDKCVRATNLSVFGTPVKNSNKFFTGVTNTCQCFSVVTYVIYTKAFITKDLGEFYA